MNVTTNAKRTQRLEPIAGGGFDKSTAAAAVGSARGPVVIFGGGGIVIIFIRLSGFVVVEPGGAARSPHRVHIGSFSS